jgi:hypothetical protein
MSCEERKIQILVQSKRQSSLQSQVSWSDQQIQWSINKFTDTQRKKHRKQTINQSIRLTHQLVALRLKSAELLPAFPCRKWRSGPGSLLSCDLSHASAASRLEAPPVDDSLHNDPPSGNTNNDQLLFSICSGDTLLQSILWHWLST